MLNRILILVTLFVYCNGRNVGVFRNDYKYYDEANGWFKLHLTPVTWEDALFTCSYEGAVLVSPLNNQIQTGIANILQDQKPKQNVFFTGVNSIFFPGLYHSIDGVPLEDMPISLSKNEPVIDNGCLVFTNNLTMQSKSCFEAHPFLCYKENQNAVMVRNECGTVDHGYKRIEGSDKCYKYHSDPKEWVEAYKICHAEGGWLATHTDYMRKEFGQSRSQIFYVGYKTLERIWWDINGNLMQPYRIGGDKHCGARTWQGQFLSRDCEEYHPFLCEKFAGHIV